MENKGLIFLLLMIFLITSSFSQSSNINEKLHETSIPAITDTEVLSLTNEAHNTVFIIDMGGDGTFNGTEDYKARIFLIDGDNYRYLTDDIGTKDKLYNYLHQVFTSERSEDYLNYLFSEKLIFEYNGHLAQGEGDKGKMCGWNQDKLIYNNHNEKGYSVQLACGDDEEVFIPLSETPNIMFKYEMNAGWRINIDPNYFSDK